MNVFIAGLGLIGGSFAKAIKSKTDDTVTGFDACAGTMKKALRCGAVDFAAANAGSADIILIALYPCAAVEFVREQKDNIPPGCMIIDLCGVKRHVCGEISAILAGRDCVFIGGHPMAGRELSGFDASLPTLFEGAGMILTPSEDITRNQRLLAELFFKRLGFSAVTYSTPERHDEIIALTSQMAHIVSSAYVQNPAASRHMGFSAGSFQDMTRVARLNEDMWTELFLLNRDFLDDQIGCFIAKLEEFRQTISDGEAGPLRELLKRGRLIKEDLLNNQTK